MNPPPLLGPSRDAASALYQVNRAGVDLGARRLDELQSARSAGTLNGTELVWCAGMPEWRNIDEVLHALAPTLRAARVAEGKSGRHQWVLWVSLGLGAVTVLVAGVFLVGSGVVKALEGIDLPTQIAGRTFPPAAPDGMELAGPITVSPTARTAMDERTAEYDFRVRHYLAAYRNYADRSHLADADGLSLIEQWIHVWLAGATPTDQERFKAAQAKLVADESMQDPLVRMILVTSDPLLAQRVPLMEKALADFERLGYPPLVRFWATTRVIAERGERTIPLAELDTSALALLRQAVNDGQLTPTDGVLVADRFVDSWSSFYKVNRAEVGAIFAEAGPAHRWTSLVLEGERQIALAWKARGGGYAGTVTEKGWEGFRDGLARAREAFTEAWKLHPDRAQAAARMIVVALGESRGGEMRLWFDRTVAVRIDHLGAWSQLRSGLLPRWYGSHEALLKLGVEALNTGRFDTRVPSQLYEVVEDLGKDMKLAKGQHLYGRADIWPQLRRMYEGYIAEEAQKPWREGWRACYACVAYLAEDYNTARQQLEAIAWKPEPGDHPEWVIDLTLMPLEVAARTGSHAGMVGQAETAWDLGQTADAKALFQTVLNESKDERTQEYARRRIAGAEAAGF